MYLDIRGDKKGPAGLLSNVTPHSFIFDGVFCASMEGLLQSFKFPEHEKQCEVCLLPWREAQLIGRGQDWKIDQLLYWQGLKYRRDSLSYQELLDRAYEAKFTNSEFRQALIESGDAHLDHTIGKSDPRDTVLTTEEFLIRLNGLRARLLEGKS